MEELSLHDLPSRGLEHRRHDRLAQRRRQQARRRRTATVLLVCLVLFGGAAYTGYGFVRPIVADLTATKDYTGEGAGSVEVQITDGASGRAIGEVLATAGVVKTADAFVGVTKADPRAGRVQPGTYALRGQMSAAAALALLLDPASRVAFRITLPEAIAAARSFEIISADTGVPVADLQAAVGDPAVGLPPEAQGNPEGYLFPATYTFSPDTPAVDMLAAMVARSAAAMDALGVPADQRRTVLVKASLVEAEARRAEDLAKVARVLENRLAAGMALQLDSTVGYVTGNQEVTTTQQQRATDSPYNTYRYPGLPPGPINAPGEAGLRAVLAPEPGPWLFFVAVDPDTGETRFAATAEEHAANVELYRAWLREHR